MNSATPYVSFIPDRDPSSNWICGVLGDVQRTGRGFLRFVGVMARVEGGVPLLKPRDYVANALSISSFSILFFGSNETIPVH